ncbi:hypothetical protein H2200_005223 [Cladophialophora chaetospira]|uniref:DUF218 domain-containing protein n=1 Tax=Cladophialophora chaetospira TaxID=386627 RepID=A0AA38XBS0_9EURO|nr:hypothetical protein H2200_005223 [Cladophialophora chaetospira]
MVPFSLSSTDVSDIDTISEFLAHSEIPSLHNWGSVDVIVLCGNAILQIAEHVFSALTAQPLLAKTLVICGGIGHSTRLLYEAFGQSRKYSDLAHELDGLPEAIAYELMLQRYYPELAESIKHGTLKLIIEDKSENCGANAIQTRRVLELHAISTMKSCVIVQDPTMSLRTLAAFQHTYKDVSPSPEFFACPTFVPKAYLDEASQMHILAKHAGPGIDFEPAALWKNQRFFDLLMGEIPRLRDDENGYGPNGKNFIVHVTIPEEVEAAWTRLHKVLDFKR